jgi:hypothetical protein
VNIRADDYEALKAFFGWMVENVLVMPAGLPPEHHPIAALAHTEARSMAMARRGLRMAIGDLVEQTQDFPRDRVNQIDDALAASGLPTLSYVRARFWSKVASIMKRGRLRSEGEYYALRNFVDAMPASQSEEAWRLLADFETRVSAGASRA